MQEEEEQDDDSYTLIEKAKEQQEYGESISLGDAKDPIKCKPFLDSLILALVKRESALGRYTYETAQTYSSMGSLFFHMRHPRAAVMFRSGFRIEYFLYGKCSGHLAGEFKGFLLERGLTENDTEEIRKDILNSARLEVEGDILRRFGDRRAAAMEYQKAARLEELAFGKDNPDLAFLWRKMACLASIKKVNMQTVDFEECDRVGPKWLDEEKDHISSTVSAGIRRGDKYYQSLLYSKAIKEYVKATLGNRPRQIPKQKPRRNNRRTSTGTAPLEQELHSIIGSSSSSVQSRPLRPQSRFVGNAASERLSQDVGSEQVAIQVSAEALPMSSTRRHGAASQDSSQHSRTVNISQQPEASFSIPSSKRLSISSESLELKENLLILKEAAESKDSEEKSQDLDTVAIESSVATSDDGSWCSQRWVQEEDAKPSSSKQRPFMATSLYEKALKNSSRTLGESRPKKPKSESALRYMTLKPAAKLANRAMKKLRKKKATSELVSDMKYTEEGNNMTPWQPPPPPRPADQATPRAGNLKGAHLDSETQHGMPMIKEMSSPESSSSRPTDDEIPSSSIRSLSSSRHSVRSRRKLPGPSARRLSSDSITTEERMIEKPRSRRRPVSEYRPQRPRKPRQREFKKVIPSNQNYQSDVDTLVKVVGGKNGNRFLVFEDPSNSSSSPSPTGLNKRR